METKAQETLGTIRDDHELRALEHSLWGKAAVERAASAVLAYNGDTHRSDGSRCSLRFFVNRTGGPCPNGEPGPDESFEAWTPYRSVVYIGDSLGQAVASMLHGVAELAYAGNMHPDRPTEMGAPPIQHVLNILTDRLKWQTERREEKVRDHSENLTEPAHAVAVKGSSSFDRDNQIIAALGTAIAALGRVNDL